MEQQKRKLTRGQLERLLSQRLQSLYRDQLGHQPSKVTCQLFDEKLAVVFEGAITAPEQLLASNGQVALAEQVRSDLEKAIEPQLKALIETVLGVPVLDLLINAALITGRSGMIVILGGTPEVSNPETISKVKR
jgi:uncharacterized protein YbcI